MSDLSDSRQLGDYRLKELLAETDTIRSWLAEQVSISRLVLVNELGEGNAGERREFLADVRAKAAVDHPLVGSVYEAVAEPELCFYAYELLPGRTLAALQKAGEHVKPASLTQILGRVAEAQLQHEALDQATLPLDLEAIHRDEYGVIRLKNLVVAGPRPPEQSIRDVAKLGASLGTLVADGQPGATRLLTLLAWMRGEGLEAPISWKQVFDFCQQIETQLAGPISSLSTTQYGSRLRRKPPIALISGAAAVVLLGIMGIALKMRPSTPPAPPHVSLPQPVTVEAGEYLTPDSLQQILPAFKISANEVTIGEYAEFLDMLDLLAADHNDRIFDHAEQPTDKASHLPDNWDALLAAAKSNTAWNGTTATLDSPVICVDWWDAVAFAEWKKARLPTQEEWFAALMVKVRDAASIAPGPWLPVISQDSDRTPTGLLGMAGSVCEWTENPSPNPANPLGEKLWVLIGGSYLKSGSDALSREWIADRSLRRPDIGFRLAYDAE
jgi:hypothetical protein